MQYTQTLYLDDLERLVFFQAKPEVAFVGEYREHGCVIVRGLWTEVWQEDGQYDSQLMPEFTVCISERDGRWHMTVDIEGLVWLEAVHESDPGP